MVDAFVYPPVGNQGTWEIFGYVHELMDDHARFVIVRKLVEMLRKDFDNIVGRSI